MNPSGAAHERDGLTLGDPEAFAAVYRRYERPLLAFFLRRTGQPELAADLTAEVFAAALVGRSRYRADRGSMHVWLFTIAQRKLIDSARRGRVEDRARRRLGMAPVSLDDEDLERIERTAGSDAAVDAMLSALPAEERDAIRARVLEERRYDEIARALECSEAVVRKRVSRGLARLRDTVERSGS